MYIVYSLGRQLTQDSTRPSFQPIVTMVNIHVEIWGHKFGFVHIIL